MGGVVGAGAGTGVPGSGMSSRDEPAARHRNGHDRAVGEPDVNRLRLRGSGDAERVSAATQEGPLQAGG